MQLDTVNAFIYTDIIKTVFLHMFPGYAKNSKVIYLNKALYCLKRSFLLWLQKLTNKLKKLVFKEIPQELYIVQKMALLVFFI